MGNVLLFDAERMQEIEDTTVVDGHVDIDGHLILEQRDGTPIDAGDIRAPNLADASTTVKGIVELSTDAESITGTSDVLAVTPKSLSAKLGDWYTSLPASTTDKGFVELATAAEAKAATSGSLAVTPLSIKDLVIGNSLAAGVDLDTYVETGQYHQGTAANADVALNYPLEDVGGLLVVEAQSTFVVQTYSIRPVGASPTTMNRVFTRSKFSSNGWSKWAETTNPSSKRGVIPSSIVVGSGSASVSEDGTITFTGVSSLSLNDIFDGIDLDMYEIFFNCIASVDLTNILSRFRTSAGVDLSAANSYGADYYGTVNHVASSGGTSGTTLTSMYFGYGRTGSSSGSVIWINKPRGNNVKEQLIRTYAWNYVDYTMGSYAANTAAYSGLTIFPSSGTMSGTLKVVKI